MRHSITTAWAILNLICKINRWRQYMVRYQRITCPERGSTYCIAEDPVNANLLFTGTEFGIYASIDGGAKWLK
jgi:hypothetical protein